MSVRMVVGFVSALVALATGPARAQEFPDNPLIQQGVDLYNDMEYEASVDMLQRALVRAENVPDQKIAIFKYLALDHLVLGRMEDARQAFRQLLAIHPEYQLDPAIFSPDHVQFLEGVRQQWEAEGRPGWIPPEQRLRSVAVDHQLPDQAARGESLELTATVNDQDGRMARLVLAYRPAASPGFVRIETVPGPQGYSAVVPGDQLAPPVIEYFFEALDAGGTVVGGRGDERVPLRVPVPAEEDGGIVTQWWFWTVIGVAVVAGIAIPVGLTVGGGGGEGPAAVTIVLCDPSVPGDCR